VWRLGAAIGLLATASFAMGIYDHSFVDEYAYITQSYYTDLFFEGRVNDPAWLVHPAFDLPPLPKYFIGAAFRMADVRMPGPRNALQWYEDTHTTYGPPWALTAARWPFIAPGVLGCVTLLVCGALVGGRWIGAIGGCLLALNPLYRLHAHRAMSDVPCEAFVIVALTLALWSLRRLWSGSGLWPTLAGFAASGACAGLAILCKLSGLLAPMVIACWGLGALVSKLDSGSRLALWAGGALMIATAVATTLALNPALTASPSDPVNQALAERASQGPWGRFREMIQIRLENSRFQQQKFSHNALTTLADRLPVFAVQGFGRFGPLGPSESDSTVRYALRQDWGLLLWWPLVVLGVVRTYRLGRQQLSGGLPPTALALLIWAAVAWAVVAVYLPMAWDRYLLPIQAPNALLAAVGFHWPWTSWRRKAVDD
jgi:hypothetical protein